MIPAQIIGGNAPLCNNNIQPNQGRIRGNTGHRVGRAYPRMHVRALAHARIRARSRVYMRLLFGQHPP